MSNIWGKNIRVSIFGESHGKAIGIIVDGLPPGEEINMDQIVHHMQRRAPGNSQLSTPRREKDEVEILSGLFKGKTSGAPLCGIIRNEDTHSQDYDGNLPRPGTADLTAFIKYNGNNDYRGGGHFSGRITAPLTFAGSVARQILERSGILIGAHICQIANIHDKHFREIDTHTLKTLALSSFPIIDEAVKSSMTDTVLKAKEEGNSVGGAIECAAIGLPAGLGSPFFESMESSISSMMFSIPGIKGIEFGSGFGFATLLGSQANDEIFMEEGSFKTRTNHNGGINGGISNGMPIVFRVVIKPTASITQTQNTVDLETLKSKEFKIIGRHDPCIVPRAVVVVESALALCILDSMFSER